MMWVVGADPSASYHSGVPGFRWRAIFDCIPAGDQCPCPAIQFSAEGPVIRARRDVISSSVTGRRPASSEGVCPDGRN